MTDDLLLGQLAEEFTRRVREGRLPDIEEYASRYPELAGRIRELFPTLMMLEGMAVTSDSAAAEPLPSGLSAGSTFGQYRIEREIGRGGMGIVYEAIHLLLEKRVALKVLPVLTTVDAAHLERFFREARTAAGLHHTNIVPVFDVGQVAGTPYYAMQYIEGRGLDRILKLMQPAGEFGPSVDLPSTDATGEMAPETQAMSITKSTSRKKKEPRPRAQSDPSVRIGAGLPARQEDYFRWVAGIGIQAAEGLAYAHERKVVHRDIKPSNLLLDSQGVLWITDFGLARRIEDPAMTQSGTLIGTPRYMSPEQAEAAKRPVDQRSDIYSLGVTLYELLTCRAVFEGKTPQEVLSQILAREPVAPRRLNAAIPADLETVVMKAMAKRPEDRYQSAQELAGDLQRWLKLEPIHARRIGPLGRTIRWCRRNPRLAAVTAVGAAIILTLSGVYYWGLLKENADTRAALQLANRQSYEANLTAADLHLNANRTQEAKRRLLLCDPALRGWEWRHVFLETDSSLASLNARGNFDEVPYLMSRFAFSGDGKRFFWNTQVTLEVWDSATNQPLAMYSGFGSILAVTGDGTRILAYALKQKAMQVLDPVSGQVFSTLASKSEGPQSATFSPDGKRIATGYHDGILRLWDAASGKNLALINGHKNWIRCLAFTPDGTRIASGSMDETLRLWDASTGKPVMTLKGNDGEVTSIAFSHDGKHMSTGSWKGHVQVWDFASGKPVATMTAHEGAVLTVAYSRDDAQIVSGGEDSTVRLWDAISGKEIATLTGHYDQASVNSVAFRPDGSRILSGAQFGAGAGGEVRIWSIDKGRGFTSLKGHESSIECIAFSPDGKRIVSASDDRTARIWDAESGHAVLILKGHDDEVKSIAFSPDGGRIVSGSADKTVRVWDAHSGKAISSFSGHSSTVNSVAFSPDGMRLASGSQDRTVRVWDAISGRLITTITLLEQVNAVAFSPDGARILTGSGDPSRIPNQGRSVRGWDAASGSNLFNLNLEGYPENGSAVSSVAFSGDGKRIAATFTGYLEIGVWDAYSGKQLAALVGHRGPARVVAFSPDCGRIISGGTDGTIRVWDASSYESLLTLTGPGGGVHSVAFSPDGTRIASGFYDKTIRIWDSRSAYYPENPETVKLVSSLFKQFTFASDVIQHLQNDAKLDPDLRKAALQAAQTRGDYPAPLNDGSWSIVKSPGGSAEAYRRALKMAEVASRTEPWDWSYLNTLGVAQYRTGAYQDAIATLMHCEEMRESPSASDVAFLAMARFKAGQTSQARADMEQLRTLMKDPDRSSDPELQGFLREAEVLIR